LRPTFSWRAAHTPIRASFPSASLGIPVQPVSRPFSEMSSQPLCPAFEAEHFIPIRTGAALTERASVLDTLASMRLVRNQEGFFEA